MKALSVPLRTRLGHTIRRLLRVGALSLVVFLVIELLSPIAWRYFAAASRQYSPIFTHIVVWVVLVVAFYVAIEALRIRKSQWRNMGWYLPLWAAVPLGWMFAAWSEHLRPGIRPRPVAADWQYAHQIAFFLLALGVAILLRRLLRRESPSRPEPAAVNGEQGISWPAVSTWISSGEQPITQSDQDLFHHQPIARRIAHTVGTEGRHLALLGPFGAGKTSIVNMARAELKRFTPTVIVATADVWAVPAPEDVPRLVLRRIVAALDDHIDTLELRTLPLTYQRLVAAEPTGRLSRILGLDAATDSVEAIGRLTPLLEVLDARLVLVVQDVERTGKGFETRHLDRFLWAFRELERASFILAIDPENAPTDYSKLCDTIELIPYLDVRQVDRILRAAYAHWTTEFPDIDPHEGRREGGKLGLGKAAQDGLPGYLAVFGENTPIAAMVALLATPRSLKHVLRRVDYTWERLHGEVELDDVLILAVLRHSAAPAFTFLTQNVEALRLDPVDTLPRTKTVKGDWDECRRELPNPAAVKDLVELLGIRQLREAPVLSGTDSPQGVRVAEPTDYFGRVLSEAIDGDEIRDQTVLRDVERWQAERDATLVTKLVDAAEGRARYALVWEHFSSRQSDADLMVITEAVVATVLERDGASADGSHPALISLWRACIRRFPRDRHAAWIRDLILSAVPTSLNLANDLFSWWTGDNGIVTISERTRIRADVVKRFRDVVQAGGDLARVLSPQYPYSVLLLITQFGAETDISAYRAWQDYLPPILIDGARQKPEVVIPELANLVGDEQSGYRAGEPENPPVFLRRYKINRERMTVLFEHSLDEALALLAEYDGKNPYAVRAKQDAALWLKERRTQGGGK